MIETPIYRVYREKNKLPTPWTFNILKRYKRNTIKEELYRAMRTPSNFTNAVTLKKNQFKSACYPMHFVNSVIREFTTAQEDNRFIVPLRLFKVKKKTASVEIPFFVA